MTARRLVRPVLIAGAMALSLPATAGAASITVSSTADEAVTNATCTLREAVINANNDNEASFPECDFNETSPFGADTINLTVNPTLTIPAGMTVEENGSAQGDLDVLGPLTIAGSGGVRVIDQNEPGDDQRVIDVPTGADLTLRDVSIRGGTLDDSAAGNPACGGDIRAFGATADLLLDGAEVRSGVISKSGVASVGAGICADASSVTLDNGSNVTANSALSDGANSGNGAGINVAGSTDLTVTGGSHVDGNFAGGPPGSGGFGGGINFASTGDLVVSGGSTVNQNQAGGQGGTGLGQGGGIRVTQGAPVQITGSQVNGNFSGGGGGPADGTGGGILIDDPAASLTLTNSQVSANSAGGNGGTGAGDGAGILSFADVTATGSTISGNVGGISSGPDGSASGGGINMTSGSAGDLTLTNSTLSGNQASLSGGGVEMASDGVLQITGSTLSSNSSGFSGGAIHRQPAPNSTPADSIDTTTFSQNTAGPSTFGRGGAIEAATNGTMTIARTTLTGNTATGLSGNPGLGGALSLNGSITGAGEFTVVNSTVHANSAAGSGDGGNGGGVATGVILGTQAPHVELALSTVTSNIATDAAGNGGRGGNVFATSSAGSESVVMRGSILAGGSGDAGERNCAVNSPIIFSSFGFNLEDSTPSQCGLSLTSDLVGVDPQLGPLANNGGSPQTRALLTGSPAIDRIPAANCAAFATDERGIARPQGSACDSGAFEVEVLPEQPPGDGGGTGGGSVAPPPIAAPPATVPNPLCAPLRKKLKKAKTKAQKRKLRKKLRRLGC